MRWKPGRPAAPSAPQPNASPDPSHDSGPSWADRLEAVGRTLDHCGDTVRDVAVVTHGNQTVLSALVLRLGTHHSGWIPASYAVVDNALVPIDKLSTDT